MNDWIDVEKSLPDDKFKKYLVKDAKGKEIPAFFMPDKAAWISWYGRETSYWIEIESPKLIYDVTHWKILDKEKITG